MPWFEGGSTKPLAEVNKILGERMEEVMAKN